MSILKKLDIYIIKKFLGTFFLSILLVIVIAVVFDVTEKIDDFMENHAPLDKIIFDYYCNFIPYLINLLSPLFTFIAVILFTSKLADNSEIIAILSTGTSYHRLVRPYLISAGLIAIGTFILSGYIIPSSNVKRIDFQELYIKKKKTDRVSDIQLEVSNGQILYINLFERENNKGYRCSLDKFDGKKLISRVTADTITWEEGKRWRFGNYTKREFDGMYEKMTRDKQLVVEMDVQPEDFFIFPGMQEQMTNPKLKNYIKKQQGRGFGNVQEFQIEYDKRIALPFAAFILTIIGVSLSSRKIKGGMGKNLAFGLLLSFTYIFFYTVSSTFAVNRILPSVVAVWLPNIVFAIIAAIIYRKRAKQ